MIAISNSTRLGSMIATTSPRPIPSPANCAATASVRSANSSYVSSTWSSRKHGFCPYFSARSQARYPMFATRVSTFHSCVTQNTIGVLRPKKRSQGINLSRFFVPLSTTPPEHNTARAAHISSTADATPRGRVWSPPRRSGARQVTTVSTAASTAERRPRSPDRIRSARRSDRRRRAAGPVSIPSRIPA